jgi:hypothetical protein
MRGDRLNTSLVVNAATAISLYLTYYSLFQRPTATISQRHVMHWLLLSNVLDIVLCILTEINFFTTLYNHFLLYL